MVEVSVVTSVFFGTSAENLIASLTSLEVQIFRDFEVIVVADGPVSPEVKMVLLDFETRLDQPKIIWLEENVGLQRVLNIGLAHAKGKYVARMDDDDISSPDRFLKQVHELEKNPYISILDIILDYFM